MIFMSNAKYQEFFDNEVNKRIEDIKEEYEKKIEELNETLDRIEDDNLDASIAFDFPQMNVFSIERVSYKTDHYKTVIGYTLNGSVKEWSLYCSLKQHENLVNSYNEYKKVSPKLVYRSIPRKLSGGYTLATLLNRNIYKCIPID